MEILKLNDEIKTISIGDKKHPLMKLYRYVLHIDWDYAWPEHWIPFWKNTVVHTLEELSFIVERIIMKQSPSREGGQHVWIHIISSIELTDDMINMLQWICLDHHTRVWINTLRIDRGLRKWWNKLFSRHLWKKPLPKRCRKCKLREILGEMKEEYDDGLYS